MTTIIRTHSDDKDFIELVQYLDAYLAEVDGKDHAFYAQFNKTDKIKQVVLAYENDMAMGCGAIKQYDDHTMEVKRMYTLTQNRGKGIASSILQELENWAKELHYSRSILETGKKQTEAISLYKKSGYSIIPNYGQYVGIENSVCFEKALNS